MSGTLFPSTPVKLPFFPSFSLASMTIKHFLPLNHYYLSHSHTSRSLHLCPTISMFPWLISKILSENCIISNSMFFFLFTNFHIFQIFSSILLFFFVVLVNLGYWLRDLYWGFILAIVATEGIRERNGRRAHVGRKLQNIRLFYPLLFEAHIAAPSLPHSLHWTYIRAYHICTPRLFLHTLLYYHIHCCPPSHIIKPHSSFLIFSSSSRFCFCSCSPSPFTPFIDFPCNHHLRLFSFSFFFLILPPFSLSSSSS